MSESLFPDEKWAKDNEVMNQVNIALLPLYDFFESYSKKPVKILLNPLMKWRECLRDDTVLPQTLKDELLDYLYREEALIRYNALYYCGTDQDDLMIYLARSKDRIKRVKKMNKSSSQMFLTGGVICLIRNPEDNDFWINVLFKKDVVNHWKNEWLEHLRILSDENKKCLNKPLGDDFTRKGGHKNWKIVRDAIYNLYDILKPFYPSRHRVALRRRKDISQDKKADYPQALFIAIANLLRNSFPKELHDLDHISVKSKIQNLITPASPLQNNMSLDEFQDDNVPWASFISCSQCGRKKSSVGAKKIKDGYICSHCSKGD